jgi:hypothetical protein
MVKAHFTFPSRRCSVSTLLLHYLNHNENEWQRSLNALITVNTQKAVLSFGLVNFIASSDETKHIGMIWNFGRVRINLFRTQQRFSTFLNQNIDEHISFLHTRRSSKLFIQGEGTVLNCPKKANAHQSRLTFTSSFADIWHVKSETIIPDADA